MNQPRKRALVAVGTTATVILATWAIAVKARTSVDWVSLTVVHVPPPPAPLHRSLMTRGANSANWVPVAVDSKGDVVGLTYCCSSTTGVNSQSWLIRYSTRAHRWLRGFEPGDIRSFELAPSPRGGLWLRIFDGGTPAVRFVSWSSGEQTVATQFRDGWRELNDLAVSSAGRAWAAGWRGSTAGRVSYDCQFYGPASPKCVRNGWAALGVVAARGGRVHAIRAPAPAPLAGVAAGRRGDIWAFDPFHVCTRPGGRRCLGPRLVQYFPRKHRFRVYVVPKSLGQAWSMQGQTALDGASAMEVAPDDTVWVPLDWGALTVTLLRFRSGRFTPFVAHIISAFQRWTIDAAGNLWFGQCDGTPVVMNGQTGSVSAQPESGGALLQDPAHRLWYVMPEYRGNNAAPSCL